MSVAAIAGIAVGCVVGVGLIATVCVVIARCASKRRVLKGGALDNALALDDESPGRPIDD
jgi:hypothetical protein